MKKELKELVAESSLKSQKTHLQAKEDTLIIDGLFHVLRISSALCRVAIVAIDRCSRATNHRDIPPLRGDTHHR